jgi:hypothetical protein
MNGDIAMTARHAPRRLPMTPARWVALAIGVPVALAIIAWNGFSFIAQFGRASVNVDYALQVKNGQLSANVGGGNVTVRPGQAARLAGTVRYSLIRPVISRTNTATGTHLRLNCRMAIGGCELDATLTVPPRTGLTLFSGGGDLSVSGLDAGVHLSSDGGNVMVSNVAGRVVIATGGGDLTAGDLAGPLSFTTDGGNVNGTGITSPVVTTKSGGGDVTLTFTAPPSNLTIETSGGNVHVVVPRDNAGYDVSPTLDGGNLNDAVKISSQSPSKITADSGGGDITIGYAS